MFWYIIISISMIYPLSIVYAGKSSGKNTKCFALIIACLILWFFMAMRGIEVGVDTKHYCYVFTQFSEIPLNKIFTAVTYANASRTWAFSFEPGYCLMNKLLSYFSSSAQAITIVNSTIIMILLYGVIRRNSPNYLLSIWLFITLGIYQTEMNVTRNAIAILIVYQAFPFAERKQFGKYLVICLIAASFHVTALVFIPIYWFLNYKITHQKALILVVISGLIGVLFPVVSPYIRFLLPTGLEKYFIGSNSKMESLIVGILNLGIYTLCWGMLRRREREKVFLNCSVGIKMLILNLCFFGLNIGLGYASRMAALFGPYLIILVPQMLNFIESKKRKKRAVAVVVLLCGCQYILRLCVNNIGGTMPYRFFW